MTNVVQHKCAYETGRACRKPAVHEVQFDGVKHWLCEHHVRPEFHPPDLHKKLPVAGAYAHEVTP